MRGPGMRFRFRVASLILAAVEEVLVKHNCNVARAAKELGIPASDLAAAGDVGAFGGCGGRAG